MKKFHILIAILIIYSLNFILAQSPDIVWVDDDYTSATNGWGTTHFAVIQDGINAVAENGTVNVAAGTWNENIIIQNGKSLIGAGIGQSFINGDAGSYTILVRDTGSEIKYLTLNNAGGDWDFEISLETARDAIVDNIHILENGMILSESNNCTISNNLIEGSVDKADFFISTSWSNVIENNVFNNVEIWLWDYSCNNILSDNTFIAGGCTAIRSRMSHNNLYKNNTIQDARVNFLLTRSNNNILAGNNISGHWDNPTVSSGGIVVFSGNNNTIINNNIDDVRDGGITLFGASSNNIIQSNSITNAERGIDIYYDSNNNTIINNSVTDNSVGIILDNTTGNIVCENNISNNQTNGYDDGNNEWNVGGRGNYWSDYHGEDQNGDGVGDTPHTISSSGSDQFPSVQTIPIILATVPSLQLATYEAPKGTTFQISDEQTRSGAKSEMHESFIIKSGGTLILDNVNWEIASDYLEPFIIVESGGSLRITNSKIISQGGQIETQVGATLHIENSELVGFGTWNGGGGITIACDNAIIKDNVIKKCYDAIVINSGASGYQIINNRILEAFTGITQEEQSSENLIEGNTIYNMISSAIWAGGLKNSTISNNTFRDIWCETILLVSVGVGANSEQNIIQNNSFFNCGPSGQQGNENFDHNNVGNYYSDYLDRYPDAQEQSGFSGIWNKPYVHNNILYPDEGGSFYDNYPLMYPVYLDTTVATPGQPALLSPTINSVITPTDLEIKWNSSNAATSYRLQIAAHQSNAGKYLDAGASVDNPNFGSPIFNQGGIDDTMKVVNLNELTLYDWRVLAENSGVISTWSEVQQFTTDKYLDVELPIGSGLPLTFELYNNYPNPFNPSTTINYTLPRESDVTITIYDMLGRNVQNLISKKEIAGNHSIQWNGTDQIGNPVSAGIYLYQIKTSDFIETKKMVLLK